MTVIPTDAVAPTELDTDSASELFLKQWKAAPDGTPANTVEGEKKDTAPVDADDLSDDEDILLADDDDVLEDPNEGPESTDKPAEPKYVEDDESMVKVSVDGQDLTVSIKELKRLAGQEASLTRKSMELATRRKEAEEIGTYHAQGLARLVQMAEEEYAPYANIDFLVAAKELDADELRALREEANSKYQKYHYLTSELHNHNQHTGAQRAQLMQAQASATIQELTSPETGIPNWGPKLYEEVGNYAISKGMKAEVFTTILDAPSLRILHDAYRMDRAQKVATKKKASGPKTVLKSSSSPDSGRFDNDKSQASMSRLRQTGSRDDAVSALLAKWGA
jgi:hypothetical protein